jgi:hypothetical protein
MLRRVDRGTHFSLVPMHVGEQLSCVPVDARTPRERLRDAARDLLRRAGLPELFAAALLLGALVLAFALLIPRL